MDTIYTHIYHSRYGVLILGDYKGRLCMLDWQYRDKRQQIDERVAKYCNAAYKAEKTEFHLKVIEQIEQYFSRERTNFDLPLLLAGSDFQKKVWQQLLAIPYGQTITYLTLSRQLGDEKAIRAVASANGANAVSIIIPCHRVIGSNGSMTGYAGGTTAKQKLLQLEGALQQMDLFGEL